MADVTALLQKKLTALGTGVTLDGAVDLYMAPNEVEPFVMGRWATPKSKTGYRYFGFPLDPKEWGRWLLAPDDDPKMTMLLADLAAHIKINDDLPVTPDA